MSVLQNNRKSGVVLPVVLVLIFCGFIVAAMLAIHAGRSLSLTRRSLEYQRASILADSGLGYGVMYVKSEISKLGRPKFLSTYSGDFNTLVNDNSANPDLKNIFYNYDRQYRNGVCFKITASKPSEGWVEVLVQAVSRNEASGIASAVEQKIELSVSELSDYAAFYEYDLEAWPGENMTFKGKVHSNGNLWIGADKLMKFERNVTAVGNFYAQRKPDSGYGDTAYVTSSGRVQFRKGNDADYSSEKPAKYADVINNGKRMDYTGIGAAKWTSESTKHYEGALQTAQSKISAPISVSDDPHSIIERPVEEGKTGYNADTESVKFSNKACLTIRIDSAGGLHLYDRKHEEIENPESYMQPAQSVSKESTTTGQYKVQRGTYTDPDDEEGKSVELPAYQVDNYFYDRREDMAMQPVDIYIDELLQNEKLRTILYPEDIADDELAASGVLYVTRDEPNGYPADVESKDVKEEDLSSLENEGWEQEKEPTEEPLYTVWKKGVTTYTYYYTDTRTRKTYYVTTTTYRNTQYTENRKTYKLDSSKTTTSNPTIVKTGQTLSEADAMLKGHTDYYKEQEDGVAKVYHLRKANYIPTQACVRLRNASNLSLAGTGSDGKKRGLSIASDLPLYVEGSFNTDGQKGKSNDTCETLPSALVAADAVTMLSGKWKDDLRVPNWSAWNEGNGMVSLRPTENLSSRGAIETTFNGILMTGLVESNNGTYSGGLQNLFRFHETWRPNGSVIPYNFNGSMVCMWLSKVARNPIEGSYTYEPPSRPWGWAKMTPPGLTEIMSTQETEWKRIDFDDYEGDGF